MGIEKYQREYDILKLLTTLVPIFLAILLFASTNSINIEAVSSLASNNSQWNSISPCSSANSISLENQCILNELNKVYVPQYTVAYFVILVTILFTMLNVSFLMLSRYSSNFLSGIFLFLLALLVALELVYLSNVILFYEQGSSLGGIFSVSASWMPLLELLLVVPSTVIGFSIAWGWFDRLFIKSIWDKFHV
ncbi:MAG: hypothetical protein ACP5UH_02860 [Candidatus Micrarchaeia archaeon]